MSCWHDYIVVNENDDGIMEWCKLCSDRNRISKDRRTGRIDNNKYLKDHKRLFLQRGSKDYERIYGKATNPNEGKDKLIQSYKDVADQEYEESKWRLKRKGEWRD